MPHSPIHYGYGITQALNCGNTSPRSTSSHTSARLPAAFLFLPYPDQRPPQGRLAPLRTSRDPCSYPRLTLPQSLLHGDPQARAEGETQILQHSKLIGRNKVSPLIPRRRTLPNSFVGSTCTRRSYTASSPTRSRNTKQQRKRCSFLSGHSRSHPVFPAQRKVLHRSRQ